jgi:hypothetical protein
LQGLVGVYLQSHTDLFQLGMVENGVVLVRKMSFGVSWWV